MSSPPTRRLAAVMIADVAGYSRLMERDEAGTHAQLLEIRAQVTDPAVLRHGGRIVRTVGDGILVEFPSAMSALQAAVEIQRTMAERNRGLPADRRIDHRIGINLGDILVEEHDIAGNGVNVAARLEAIAPPGGIAISATVRDQVRQDLGVRFLDAGEQHVKNISRPIRVYKVEIDGSRGRLGGLLAARRWIRWAVAVALLLVAGFGARLAFDGWAPVQRPAQSLLILPFTYTAELRGAEPLAASLLAQLTGALSRVSTLTVIAPAVAARYADRRQELQSIGRELKVRYVLDGRLERAGELLRLTAQLVDSESGESLWSSEIDAPAPAGDAAPLALVGRLAETLRAAVREAELKRLAAGREAASAYAIALAASHALQSAVEPPQIQLVRQQFERALQLDPQHGPALIGYAHVLVYEADRTPAGEQRDALLARADEYSLRAVTVQPTNAEAWAARANVLYFRGPLEAAAEAVQRGLALNPYLIVLQSFHGQILLAQGDGERALAAFERGLELNPTSMARGVLMHFRCRALFLLERYPAAVESCQRGMAFGPEWPDYMMLAAAYALQGDRPRAEQARRELLRLQPGFSIGWHERLGGRGGARTRFQQLLYAGLQQAGVAP